MINKIKNYSKNIVLIVSIVLFITSCSKDLDDTNRYNIEGLWRLEGIYTYDLEGNLIDSKYYDQIWDVQKDSIEYTNSYDLSEDVGGGKGILKGKFSYKTFPDGGFYHSQQMFKIDVLTEDDLIFSIRRPDLIHKIHYYSIDWDWTLIWETTEAVPNTI